MQFLVECFMRAVVIEYFLFTLPEIARGGFEEFFDFREGQWVPFDTGGVVGRDGIGGSFHFKNHPGKSPLMV